MPPGKPPRPRVKPKPRTSALKSRPKKKVPFVNTTIALPIKARSKKFKAEWPWGVRPPRPRRVNPQHIT